MLLGWRLRWEALAARASGGDRALSRSYDRERDRSRDGELLLEDHIGPGDLLRFLLGAAPLSLPRWDRCCAPRDRSLRLLLSLGTVASSTGLDAALSEGLVLLGPLARSCLCCCCGPGLVKILMGFLCDPLRFKIILDALLRSLAAPGRPSSPWLVVGTSRGRAGGGWTLGRWGEASLGGRGGGVQSSASAARLLVDSSGGAAIRDNEPRHKGLAAHPTPGARRSNNHYSFEFGKNRLEWHHNLLSL